MQTSDRMRAEAIRDISAPVYIPAKERGRATYNFVKRLMDVILSLAGLTVLSPLFLAVYIAIKLDSKGPVIYSQTRIGESGKPFTMYKFRSMCADADEKLKELQELNERDGPVFKIRRDPRVTRVGVFIRKTCIDELPQLVNVIKGEMSLVGPRPALPNEVMEYTPHQRLRLNAIPGLTCYWQVCERKNVTFAEWVEMDLKYIRECGPIVDITLILKTLRVILRNSGSD